MSTIVHFETGIRLPSFKNLVRLADALGVSMDFLAGRSATMIPFNVVGTKEKSLLDLFWGMSQDNQYILAGIALMLKTGGHLDGTAND